MKTGEMGLEAMAAVLGASLSACLPAFHTHAAFCHVKHTEKHT